MRRSYTNRRNPTHSYEDICNALDARLVDPKVANALDELKLAGALDALKLTEDKSSVPTPPSLAIALTAPSVLPPSIKRAVLDYCDDDTRRAFTRSNLGTAPEPELDRPRCAGEYPEPELDFVSEDIERLHLEQEADRIDADLQRKASRRAIDRHLDLMGDTDNAEAVLDWHRSATKRIDRANRKRSTTCPSRGGSFKAAAKLKRNGRKFKLGIGLGGDCGLPTCTSEDCRRMWATSTAKAFLPDLMFSPVWYRRTITEAERSTVCDTLKRKAQRARRDHPEQRPQAHIVSPSSITGTVDIWATEPPTRQLDQWTKTTRSTAGRIIQKTILAKAIDGPIEAPRLAHIHPDSLPEGLPALRPRKDKDGNDVPTWAASSTNGPNSGQTEKWETVWSGISTKKHDLESIALICERLGMSYSVSKAGQSASALGELTDEQEADLTNSLEALFDYVAVDHLHRRKLTLYGDQDSRIEWENSLADEPDNSQLELAA